MIIIIIKQIGMASISYVDNSNENLNPAETGRKEHRKPRQIFDSTKDVDASNKIEGKKGNSNEYILRLTSIGSGNHHHLAAVSYTHLTLPTNREV